MNDLTKCVLVVGGAALTISTTAITDLGYRQFSKNTASHVSTIAYDYVRASTPDGRNYSFISTVDDTVFDIPIVAQVRIKLKKGFLPFEFFIED